MGARMSHVTAYERAALYDLDELIKRDRWRNMTIIVNASRRKTIVLISESHELVDKFSGLKNDYIAAFLKKLMKECKLGFDFYVEDYMMDKSSDIKQRIGGTPLPKDVGDVRELYKWDHGGKSKISGPDPLQYVRELARKDFNPCFRIRFRIGDVRDVYAHAATGTDIYGKPLRSIVVPVDTAKTVMNRYFPSPPSGDFSAESSDEMLKTFNVEKVRVDAMAHRVHRVLGRGKSWMGTEKENKDWREKLTLMTDNLVHEYKDNMQRIVKKRADKNENLTKLDVEDAYDVVNRFTDVYSMSKMLAPDAHPLVIWYGGKFHTDNMISDLTKSFGFEIVSFGDVTRVWPVVMGVKTPSAPVWPYIDPTTGSVITKRRTVGRTTGRTLRRKKPRKRPTYNIFSKTMAARRADTTTRQRASRSRALSSARGFK